MARALLVVLVLVALVPVVLSIASRRSRALGLVNGRLAPCPSSPNCVCSESTGTEPTVAPLSFTGEPAAAFRSLLDFLRREPRVEIVRQEEGYAHAVFQTPLLRFRDDVELRLDAQAHVIHVRSASRVGHSDLGANKKRVESIRARWNAAHAPGAEAGD